MNKEQALILTNICKTYHQGKTEIKVLDKVSLAVTYGESVSIIGNSGSGKSTLLHIAGLLDTPDSGSVEYNSTLGVLPKMTNDKIRLNYIGFVYQQHHLLKDFSARENVALPSLIVGKAKALALEEADHLLDLLGLSNRIHNMPGELSGGEQQRVAIARSLINKPRLILADEPTGNLDPHTAEEVFDLFLKLSKEQNTAMIMVTHNHFMAKKTLKCYEIKYGCLKHIE